jgi:hypothetical protein
MGEEQMRRAHKHGMMSSDDTEASSSARQLALLYRAYTMSMMPPGGLWHIGWSFIHRSS